MLQGVSLFCSRPCTQPPLCAQSVPMSVIAPSSPPAPRSRLALYLDLIRFNRPAGWLVLIWPTLTALWVAADGFPGWHLLLVFGLGTVLMRSAGCTINDIADRNFDKHVKRTTARPITSGELSVKEAALVGAVLALLALGLVLTTRWEALGSDVQTRLIGDGGGQLGGTLEDLRRTSAELSALIATLERHPQSLLLGRPGAEPGPGESGYIAPVRN